MLIGNALLKIIWKARNGNHLNSSGESYQLQMSKDFDCRDCQCSIRDRCRFHVFLPLNKDPCQLNQLRLQLHGRRTAVGFFMQNIRYVRYDTQFVVMLIKSVDIRKILSILFAYCWWRPLFLWRSKTVLFIFTPWKLFPIFQCSYDLVFFLQRFENFLSSLFDVKKGLCFIFPTWRRLTLRGIYFDFVTLYGQYPFATSRKP